MLTTSWNDQIAHEAKKLSLFEAGLNAHRSGDRVIPRDVVRNGTFLEAFVSAATGAADKLLALASRPFEEIEIAAKGIESSVYKAILAGEKPAVAYTTVMRVRDNPDLFSVGFMALRQGVEQGLDALIANPNPKSAEAFLRIAQFMKDQTPYIEGVLKERSVHPTESQLDAVRSVIARMQDKDRADKLSVRLEKLTRTESAAVTETPPAP